MKVDTTPHGMVTVVVPHGPLVADELSDFRRAVESATQRHGGRVVIDLADVPYLDSGGIETLLNLYTAQRWSTGGTKLAKLTETCREALDLTDVLPRLDVFDNVENALRSFNR
jgi:anti-anti-sigma factor